MPEGTIDIVIVHRWPIFPIGLVHGHTVQPLLNRAVKQVIQVDLQGLEIEVHVGLVCCIRLHLGHFVQNGIVLFALPAWLNVTRRASGLIVLAGVEIQRIEGVGNASAVTKEENLSCAIGHLGKGIGRCGIVGFKAAIAQLLGQYWANVVKDAKAMESRHRPPGLLSPRSLRHSWPSRRPSISAVAFSKLCSLVGYFLSRSAAASM